MTGLYYMNKEQKQFKLLIKSDLRIVERNWDSDDKADRLQAAYHMQQAIEKTIKLKAYVHGIDDIWGHDIRALINWCKKKGYNIDVPKLILKNANVYSQWEADCRYYPMKVVRKNSINAAYKATKQWLESGDTAD